MKNKVSIIPFSTGKGSVSIVDNRLDYLKQTIKSLENDFDIEVFVSNKEDYDLLILNGIESTILASMTSMHLPYVMCRYMQLKCELYDYVLYTEADQLYYCEWDKLSELLSEDKYLSPNRLELIPDDNFKNVSTRGSVVEYRGLKYVAPNSPINTELNGFYYSKDKVHAFGGAFFSTVDFFKNIKFTYVNNLIVEQICFDAFNTGNCLKSVDFTFCTIHLSGEEYNKKYKR